MASWRSSISALGAGTGIRRVLVAYAVFGLVEFSTWLIIVLWAYAVGGATLAGAAALVQLLPAALLAPIVAGLADRRSRGTALVLSYGLVTVGAVITSVALAAGSPVPVVLACATLLTTAIAAARPVHFAALPDLTRAEPEQLVSATSLSSVIDGSVRFLGPVLAGAAVATVGSAVAMLGAAALGLVSAGLVVRLGLARPVEETHQDETSTLRAAVAGLRVLRRSPGSFMLLVVMGLDFVLTGTVDVLGVAYAESVLGDGTTAAGLVVGAMGIGALIGAAVSGPLAQGRWLTGVIVLGAVLEGLLFASTGAWDRLLPVMLILAAAGIGGAVTTVAGRTLLQRTTDDQVLARVFAVQESVALLGLALGAALAPLLVAWVGVQWAWVPLGLAVAVMGALSIGPLRSLDRRARWLPVELRLLRGLPTIAALPPYSLERLAHEATWSTFRAGEVIADDTRHADVLGIVGDGEASVWIGGLRVPGVLGPGGSFGEQSMLRGEPQVSTVIAETHGRLLCVTQASFRRAAGDDRAVRMTLPSAESTGRTGP